MKNKFLTIISLFLILGALFGFFYKRTKTPKIYSRSKLLMDTIVEIKVYSNSADIANKAMDLAFERGKYLAENIFDYHISTSELYKLNQIQNVPQKVSKELLTTLKLASDLSQKTNGAFDITCGSLKNLWNFEEAPFSIPPIDSINKVLKYVNYENVIIHGDSVFIKEKTIIDLGAIAKGYIADEMMSILKQNNIKKALINAGGDVALYDITNMRDWIVAVQHPRKADSFLGLIKLKNGAIATSGDYERFFFDNDKRYHHILNPKTGYPAQGLISVSILAEKAVLADMLATAVFVLGKEEGQRLIENWENTEALIVSDKGEIITTSGMKDKLLDCAEQIQISNSKQ